MNRSTILLILSAATLLSAVPGTVRAEDSHKPSLEIGDVIKRETASDFEISPGGGWTAFVLTAADEKVNRRRRRIVVRSLAGGGGFRLSSPGADSYAPRFSPDGKTLCFLRRQKKGKSQIYRYRMAGGDPEKLTSSGNGIKDFRWLEDGRIIYSAREDSTYRERQLKKKKDNTVVVADQEHYPPVRLFLLDTGSKKTRRITENQGQVIEFAPSPDGSVVVFNINVDIDYGYDHRVPPRQFLMELKQEGDGLSPEEPVEIFTGPHLNPRGYRWTPDSEGFFCSRAIASDSTETYVSIRRLYYYSPGSGRLEKVGIDDVDGLGRGYFPVRDGVVAGLAAGVRYRNVFARIEEDEVTEYPLSAGKDMPFMIQAGRERDIIYTVSDGSSVPVIRHGVLRRGRLEHRADLYTLNEGYRDKFLARTEVITWTGALEEEVEGLLYYPRGYEEGSRYPLIVSLHGGPSGYDMDFFSERWSNYPHTLAGRGAFVLKVNYHGSGNYGLEWIESIKEHYYEYEIPDILGGIEELSEEGLVDMEKLGIMGWSNGSILAIACCLETDIFKALCAGAGDVNWTSDYGNCRFGAGFDNAYFGGPPWELTETYVEKSPLFRMQQLETPTLIMFGGEDRAVPTEQGWEHFRAMQQIGKAPVRFILFPGAGHGPHKLSHQRRKMAEELAWLDRYLFEQERDSSEVLSPDSPLAAELGRLKAAVSGELLGTEKNGVLIPETAKEGDLAVGRFEVTNAQYAEFDGSHSYPAGEGNFPACGMPHRRAEEYCRWLSGKTGEEYRLPEEQEMKKLLRKVSADAGSGNNLAYWAGYTPTPGEERLLLEEIGRLHGKGALLTEAGSFPPAGDRFYDLAGNAAEWVTAEGGHRAFGLCALSNPDPARQEQDPPPEYTGFRVCRDR